MKLVVGLGNPGKEYENTRHNVGFMVLDSFDFSYTLEKKFQAFISKQKIHDEEVLFVKPITFMNLSGIAVQKIVKYYKISLEDILIIQDDLDMKILGLIRQNNKMSTEKMARALNVNAKTIKRHIKAMGNVQYIGHGYSGHWEIIE